MVYHENRKVVQLYWDDLSVEAKERLLDVLGENGNYDMFPTALAVAELVFENDETREENEECPQ